MNDLENIDVKNWDRLCIASGKSVDHGDDLANIQTGVQMIPLRCPLGIEAVNSDPTHYLRLRRQTEMNAQLHHPERTT